MNQLFPFGLPGPTAFYGVLYVVTLALHVVFMNYVFAGCGYLAIVSVIPRARITHAQGPMALILRDWMPFALSAAITAGVAPLLFVQILYPQSFYSANLLLSHRWMAILPVLIVGFYLLYLFKSKTIEDWPPWTRSAVGLGAFAAIAFTGYSWTENHLLSLDAQGWPEFYGEARWFYWSPVLLPRLGTWLVGAIPTMVTGVCWQLRSAARSGQQIPFDEPRRAATMALAGLAGAVLCGGLYYGVSGAEVRAQFTGRLVGPYLGLATLGVGIQTAAWWRQLRLASFCGRCLTAATCGTILTVLGMAVVREGLRLHTVDLTRLQDHHAAAADKGGMMLFVAFLIINALLVTYAIIRVARGIKHTVAE